MKQTYVVGFFFFAIWALFSAITGDVEKALTWWAVDLTVWTAIFTGLLVGGFKPW